MEFLTVKSYVFIVLTIILWLNRFKSSWAASSKTARKHNEIRFHRNSTGVYFDPADFLKGNALAHTLDDSGITALLRKIHSRFDTILITLNVPERKTGGFSNDQLPEIVAKHSLFLNESGSSLGNHLNVVILSRVDFRDDAKMIRSRFQEIQKLMNSANSIFPGTVDTVVLEMANLAYESCKNYLTFREFFAKSGTGNKVGIKVNLKDTIDALSSPSQLSQKFKNDVISDIMLNSVYLTENFNHVITRVPVSEAEKSIETQFRDSKSLIQNWNNLTELAVITTWADTDQIGRAKYAEYVDFWRRMNEWAWKSRTSVIFHQAFDTPLVTGTITMKTNGWWKLQPSSSYLHPSQFLFEEKISLTQGGGIEDKSRVTNTTWLSQPTEFNRAVVGVHFSPSTLKSGIGKSNLNSEATLPELIRQVSTKFSKVFISTVVNDKEPEDFNFGRKEQVIFSVPDAFANWNKNRKGDENSMELVMAFDEATAENVSRSAREANELFPGTVTQLIYSPSTLGRDKFLDGYVAMMQFSGDMKAFSFGIKLDLEVCNDRKSLQEVMDMMQEYFVPDLKIDVLYFSAMVTTENSKLGSGRFLPLLTAMFENCRNRVDEYFITRTEHMRVAFITGWSMNGEESVEGLVQFNSFWEGINTWATETNTTVIMSSTFDPLRLGNTGEKLEAKYGWWGVKKNSTTGKYDIFVDKKEATLGYVTGKVDNGSKESSQFMTAIVASVATVGVVICVALLTVFYLLKSRESVVLTKEEISRFFNGGDSNGLEESPESLSGPYQKIHLELSKTSFTIDEGSSLGSGAYGKVCLGSVRKNEGDEDEVVAVKTTKVSTGTVFAIRGLLFEIKILSHLGKHPHIVGLVGAYTAELRKGKVFVFLELCELGSLQNYLRECKPQKDSETADDQSDCGGEKAELTDSLLRDMARWSWEIANGMEFITSKQVVHLDIATRNILLTTEKQAKIADFGLSRRMYNQSYIKTHQEKIPWRSLSPESLRLSLFTEKSDVWSFGVLLWEIYSLGDEPFAGLSWDVNFPTKLERGLRLGEPTYNRNSMYSIMLRCWTTNPAGRPTFSELVSILNPTLLEAGLSSGSDSNSAAPVHNYGNISESPVTIPNQEMRNEWGVNNSSSVVSSILNKGIFCWSTIGWLRSTLAVVLLIIILTISIWYTLWRQAGTTVTHATSSKTTKYEYNFDGITRSPLEMETGQTRFTNGQNGTSLEHKLFVAISGSGRKEEAVTVLIQHGADVNARDNLLRTPLIAAANCNKDKSVCLRIIKILIDNGAEVTAEGREGYTFLHNLVTDGTLTPAQYHQIAEYLISRNMSKVFTRKRYANASDGIEDIPFLRALQNIQVENRTLALLYENGVYFNSTSPPDVGFTVLKHAVFGKGSPQLLSFLIGLGANCTLLNRLNRSLLHYAAWIGHEDGVKYFLHQGLNINAKDIDGQTPLHRAVVNADWKWKWNGLATVRVLLENGADVNMTAWNGHTPLTSVIEQNGFPDKDKVVQLLRAATLIKADQERVLVRDYLNKELLDSTDQLNEKSVKLFIQAGGNINAKNSEGETPLIRAAICKGETTSCLKIIKYLIRNGANVYAKDKRQNTFLYHLVSARHKVANSNLSPSQFHEITSFLVANNFTELFNIKGYRPLVGFETPFLLTIKNIEVEIRTLTLLYDNGVDFNTRNYMDCSVLHYAVDGRRSEKLLSKLIDLGGVDWRDGNLLHFAAEVGNAKALKFFLNKGLDINEQDFEGNTPLHKAVEGAFYHLYCLETMQVLLMNGADCKIKNNVGDTPLSIAFNRGDQKIIQMLKLDD